MRTRSIALVGEQRDSVPAHRAIPIALRMAAERAVADGVQLTWEWLRTDSLGGDGEGVAGKLAPFDGVWCVPASPYASIEGALAAIRFARETCRPFLGTCGGFQHALIEYARNVLHLAGADHAETNPAASLPLVSLLACSLVETTQPMSVVHGSRLHAIYGTGTITEGFRCRYGLNPQFESLLADGDLRVSAREQSGEVRAIELGSHPFFVATLFQPERAALAGNHAPVVEAFVRAVTQFSRP